MRLNDPGMLGITTNIRLRQAQVDNKSPVCLLNIEKEQMARLDKKYNLTCKVLKEARLNEISFHSTVKEKEMKILNFGIAISEIISDKALKNFRKNQDLNIFTIEQVMDKNSDHLLT